MGKIVIECFDRRIKTRKIAKAVCKVLGQTAKIKAELIMVDADKMKSLNSSTRGIDKVTDVLSYPTLGGIRGAVLDRKNCNTALDGKYIIVGSIVLCDEKVKEQAKEFGHSESRERTYLIVHGLLHLFGYDHMTDADKAQMRKKEKEVLALLGVVDE